MSSFTEKSARDVCVFVFVCVCPMHAYNFEEEIDLLFFEYSRKRDKKYANFKQKRDR